MTRAARSILVFGFYIAAVAAFLVVAPNALLAILYLPPTNEPWIRVLGVVGVTLGFYYLRAARANAVAFFRATLAGRPIAAVAFTVLVAANLAPPALLLFAAADLAGTIWTWRALRADARPM